MKRDKLAVRRLLSKLEGHLGESFTSRFEMAQLCFFLGNIDKGFEWLEESYQKKDKSLMDIKNSVGMDPVRDDARYVTFLKKMGLS